MMEAFMQVQKNLKMQFYSFLKRNISVNSFAKDNSESTIDELENLQFYKSENLLVILNN